MLKYNDDGNRVEADVNLTGSVRRNAAVLISAVGIAFSVLGCASSGPQLSDLPESLVFGGNISGTLAKGVNVHGQGTGAPGLSMTQCIAYTPDVGFGPGAEVRGDRYASVIVGDVGTLRVIVVIDIPADSPAYQHPGTTYAVPDGFENRLYLPGDREDSARYIRFQSSTSAVQPGTITLDTDRRGGDIDASFSPGTPYAGVSPGYPGVTHVKGHWRCG